jgi:hypothetical protein
LNAGAWHDFVIGLPLVTANIEYSHLKSQADQCTVRRWQPKIPKSNSKFNHERIFVTTLAAAVIDDGIRPVSLFAGVERSTSIAISSWRFRVHPRERGFPKRGRLSLAFLRRPRAGVRKATGRPVTGRAHGNSTKGFGANHPPDSKTDNLGDEIDSASRSIRS